MSINRAQANELWVELFAVKGKGWLSMLTGSMSPLLRAGDEVLVSKVTLDQLHSGDIVVFWRNSDLVVHRILKRWHTADGIFFSEKGDGTYTHSLVSAEKVIGRVIAVKGNGKFLNLNSSFGRLSNQVLSVWFYPTAAIVTALRSSTSKNIRRASTVLSILFLSATNVIIRSCCVFWYLSELFVKRYKRFVPER